MERVLNPRLEADTIYEIYRSCRLCGAGAGYKMPIIQNVVLDDTGVELSVKIRDCLQIEVHQDDKMPPLICELCVDKVNDFYEFLDMCKQTNIKTRTKLGLPMVTKKTSENTDSILGVTEPITVKNETDNIPVKKSSTKKNKRDKKEKVSVQFKKDDREEEQIEENGEITKRETRSKLSKQDVALNQLMKLTRSYKNVLKNVKGEDEKLDKNDSNSDEEDSLLVPRSTKIREVKVQLLPLAKKTRSSETSEPKSILKKTVKTETEEIVRSPLPPRKVKVTTPKSNSVPEPTRTSYRTTRNSLSSYVDELPEIPPKRTKNVTYQPESDISTVSSPRSSITPERTVSKKVKKKSEPKKDSKSKKKSPEVKKKTERSDRKASEVKIEEGFTVVFCVVCNQELKSNKAYANHMRIHVPTFTNTRLACNACRIWFVTSSEATQHNNLHIHEGLPYKCDRCTAEYKSIGEYNNHFKDDCIPFDEVPDVKCEDCWRYFATDNLLIQHNCPGEDGRPGGKCVKCNRKYVLLKNLKQHEENCSYKVRICGAIVDSDIKARLMQAQIRILRCDELLTNTTNEHYNIADVSDEFGLDNNCFYPYSESARSQRLKNEPQLKNDNMVNITQDLPDVFSSEVDNIPWDSDNNSSETFKDKLTDAFDANEKEFDISGNIDSIIDNLDRENRSNDSEKSITNDYDSKSIDSADSTSLLVTKSSTEVTNDSKKVKSDSSDNQVMDTSENNTENVKSAVLNSKSERSTSFDIDSLLSDKIDSKAITDTSDLPMDVSSEITESDKDFPKQSDSVKVSDNHQNGVNSYTHEKELSIDDLLDSKKMELDEVSNDDFNFDV